MAMKEVKAMMGRTPMKEMKAMKDMQTTHVLEPTPKLKAMPAQEPKKRVLSTAYKDVTSRAYKKAEAQALQHENT